MKGREGRGLIQKKETVMSEETPANGKRSSRTVWFAPKRENAMCVRIGALWPTKTGKGVNMGLKLVPRAEGSIGIMPPKGDGET